MGVSKNSGTQKWMVYNGKPYLQMDDLRGKTRYFRKHPYLSIPKTQLIVLYFLGSNPPKALRKEAESQ